MKIDTSRTVLLLTLLLQLIALPPVFLAKLDHDALMRHPGPPLAERRVLLSHKFRKRRQWLARRRGGRRLQ